MNSIQARNDAGEELLAVLCRQYGGWDVLCAVLHNPTPIAGNGTAVDIEEAARMVQTAIGTGGLVAYDDDEGVTVCEST